MKKILAPCLFLFALLGVSVALADPPVVSGAPTASAAGDIATTQQQIPGDSSCSVTNTGGSGNTVAIETSNNPAQGWSVLGSVVTGGTGTFTVGSTNTGLLWVKLTVTVYGSGTLTAGYACTGTAAGGGGSSGSVTVSPIPLPVTGFPSPYATSSPGGVLADAPGGPNGSPYPQDANGYPYVHATALPTLSVTCVAGGCPTPQPAQTAASTTRTTSVCDPTTSLACAPASSTVGLTVAGFIGSSGIVNPQICDKFVTSANISSATTTAILAVSGSNKYFICGWNIVPTGTNATNTVVLEYGTGATCGTGTTTFSATYIPPATGNGNGTASVWVDSVFATVATPASAAVCAVTAGTTTALQVQMAYALHT